MTARVSEEVKLPAGTLLVAGPSASGKSAVALELALRLNGVILSLDSMQVYRGMNLGTAKPTPEDQRRVPHTLLDLVTLDEPFNASRFLDAARVAVDRWTGLGRRLIGVGGTGLYFSVLLKGLYGSVAPDPGCRAELERTPLPELVAALAAADPDAHARVDLANKRRVIRALEQARSAGQSGSRGAREWGRKDAEIPAPVYALRRETADLRQRIHERVEAMFAAGLVEETRLLLRRGLASNRTAMQALGYRQVVEHLTGEADLPQTIQKVKDKTWQYARRQMTWFRHQLPVIWIDVPAGESPARTADRILEREGH